MAGINPTGNNGRLRKTKVESIMDFRRLSIHKGNRMITKNFTSFIAGTEPDLSDLIMFLIFESKRNNTVELGTHLITKYQKYIRIVKEHFGGKKYKGKSMMATRGMLQRLIGMGIIIPLYRQIFLINPALFYFDGYYNEQAGYMAKYEDIYGRYAAQQFGRDELHTQVKLLAQEYYKNCLNKLI